MIPSAWLGNGRLAASLVVLLGSAAVAGAAENSATTPVAGKSARWLAHQESINRAVKGGKADLLFIGDSIVANWDDAGREVWDRYYAPRHAANLGIGGDRTEHVLWRLQHGNLDGVHPKLAIVMIGQNNGPYNTAEEIAEGVKAIVQLLRAKLPETKILLLGIFFRGEKPNAEQEKLAATNALLTKLDDGRMIVYRNINAIFLAPDGSIPRALMPDCEHPSAEGFRRWAEVLEPTVAELLGDSPVLPER